MIHQCYHCEQIFKTREDLYEHLEVHTFAERNKDKTKRRKLK